MKILEASLNEKHPLFAVWLNHLAAGFHYEGDIRKNAPPYDAGWFYRSAIEVYVLALDILGESHPLYGTTLHDLAGVHLAMGEHSQAREFFRQAAEILKDAHETPADPSSPQYSMAEALRAFLAFTREFADSHISLGGSPGDVEGIYSDNLETAYGALKRMFIGMPEREQMAYQKIFRDHLDGFLSRFHHRDDMSQAAAQWSLNWKGAVFSRQRWYRQISLSRNPVISSLLLRRLNEQSDPASQLSRRSDPTPPPDSNRTLTELTVRRIAASAERDLLQAELSRQAAAPPQAQEMVELADVAGALPNNTVLVDFLEFSRWSPQQAGRFSYQPSIMASVLHQDGTVKLIDLGDKQRVGQQLNVWLDCIRDKDGIKEVCSFHGQNLRHVLWEPIQSEFGNPAPETLLISPDGILGRLPWAALPGAEPSTYLVDEFEIVIQPVSQQLPTLVKTDGRQKGRKSLLLVGDVDYDAHPVPAEPAKEDESVEDGVPNTTLGRGSEGTVWRGLPSTFNEIQDIQQYFLEWAGRGKNQIEMLTKRDATERRFRELAPKFAYLHLATHGFFDPPDEQTCQFGLLCSPDRLSGLVMAGANLHEPQLQYGDGRLTAMEVMFLPLKDVELVTLSACETGLGEIVGGEGLLGLQRAFQVAGARSTVTSLWKVPDLATSELMERFYHNLWEEEMPRSAALREAQLGLKNEPEYSRPYYWAGFQLSGAWR